MGQYDQFQTLGAKGTNKQEFTNISGRNEGSTKRTNVSADCKIDMPVDVERLRWLIEKDIRGELRYPTGLALINLQQKHPEICRKIRTELEGSD